MECTHYCEALFHLDLSSFWWKVRTELVLSWLFLNFADLFDFLGMCWMQKIKPLKYCVRNLCSCRLLCLKIIRQRWGPAGQPPLVLYLCAAYKFLQCFLQLRRFCSGVRSRSSHCHLLRNNATQNWWYSWKLEPRGPGLSARKHPWSWLHDWPLRKVADRQIPSNINKVSRKLSNYTDYKDQAANFHGLVWCPHAFS